MYEQIENIITRTLNSMEFETLERLKNNYSEQEIINTYKKYGDKPINYIQKVIRNKPKSIIPEWLGKEIQNQELDRQAIKDFEDFKKFLEEFRNDTDNNI